MKFTSRSSVFILSCYRVISPINMYVCLSVHVYVCTGRTRISAAYLLSVQCILLRKIATKA